MNFLENILKRLQPKSPGNVVLEELRPTGRVTATASDLLDRVAAGRAAFLAAAAGAALRRPLRALCR